MIISVHQYNSNLIWYISTVLKTKQVPQKPCKECKVKMPQNSLYLYYAILKISWIINKDFVNTLNSFILGQRKDFLKWGATGGYMKLA